MNNLEGVRKGFAEKADICSYRLRGSIPSRERKVGIAGRGRRGPKAQMRQGCALRCGAAVGNTGSRQEVMPAGEDLRVRQLYHYW